MVGESGPCDSEEAAGQMLTSEHIISLLIQHDIPTETWGTGEAKTIKHLIYEIQEGESTLGVNSLGELTRYLNVVSIDVFYLATNGTVLKLHEEKQVFADGRERRRNRESSIGEKLLPNEGVAVGAARALYEEAGLTDTLGLYPIGIEEKSTVSHSYPGLKSSYRIHRFVATIRPEDFKPEGYIELGLGLTTYFVWQQVHQGFGDVSGKAQPVSYP